MPAEITTSDPKTIYATPGQNMAPKRPWDERKDSLTLTPCSFVDAIQQKYQDYIKRDYETWIEHCEVGRQVANLREGKLLPVRSRRTGRLQFVKRDGIASDNKTQSGVFQFYSTKLDAEWISSNPEIDPICPSDDDQIEEFIDDVKIVQDSYFRKFFTDQYKTLESKSAQDFGTWVTRFRFDPDKKDIVCELLDFPACRWDIRFTAEESEYFIYQSKCSTAKLKHILNCDIASDGDDGEYYTLDLVEQIAKQGSNVSGWGKEQPYGTMNNVQNETVVTEMWLQPEAYCDIILEADEPTIEGTSLKKGSLLETFPNGMCVVGMNGMRDIIAVYAEDHKDHIVTGLYHVQSFRGVGKGISDTVDCKKNIDNYRSQLMAMVDAHATPATFYAQDLITEDQARNIGKPKKNIPVDFKNAPEGMSSIEQAVHTLTPVNPGQAIFALSDMLNNDLQMSFQVTDFTGGLPGVDNKTATGAKIGDANAEMILVPQHRNLANHRCRAAVVIYNIFRKYVDVPRWFVTRDKNPITGGKTLTGTQFQDVPIEFEIVADSEVPNTPLQRQMGMSAIMQYTGGALGFSQLKQTDPDFAGELAATYGVKLQIATKKDIARVCRKWVEQAKKLLQTEMQLQSVLAPAGVPFDNSNLAAQIVSQLVPRISYAGLYAQQKAEWLAALLDTDEIQYGDPELQDIIEVMIDTVLQAQTLGQVKLAADQNVGTIMANLPTLLGEEVKSQANQSMVQEYGQAQQAQAQQQQNQQAVQQGQLALEAAKQTAEIDKDKADAAHQQAMALNEQKHGQAMQLASLGHLANIEKEKARPRATA